MARRVRWAAGAAVVLLAACDGGKAEVQPLPPLQRPSPEVRAGLAEVRGAWHFAGFEFNPRDTARVREVPDLLAPPGDFNVTVQRLDSIAGTYGRAGVTYPFTGEVRRDGVVSLVAADADGVPQFAAMHVLRDTLWLELTSFPSLQVWPAGARAALVRTPVKAPFRRFLGGVAIIDQDSVRRDSVARDSVRRADSTAAAVRDSAARAAGTLPPGVTPGAPPAGAPGTVPVPPPGTVPAAPPAQAPRPAAPPVQTPRPAPRRPRPQPQRPPPETGLVHLPPRPPEQTAPAETLTIPPRRP